MAISPKCCSTLKSICFNHDLRTLWSWLCDRCLYRIWRRFGVRSTASWDFSVVSRLMRSWSHSSRRFGCHLGRIGWALRACVIERSERRSSRRSWTWDWCVCCWKMELFRCSFYFWNKIINKLYRSHITQNCLLCKSFAFAVGFRFI